MNPRIAITSLATDHLAELRSLTTPNHAAYAARHGYAHLPAAATLDPSRPPSWSKVPLLLRSLPHFDWLMWIDADAAFTAPDKPLDSLLHPTADLVIAKDENGINAGVLLMRNTPAAADFLRRVYAQVQFVHHIWWEQAAMMHLLNTGAAGIEVHHPAKRDLNAYPDDWRAGDLVLHTPGRHGRLDILRVAINATKAR
jgi:hypothetical protein